MDDDLGVPLLWEAPIRCLNLSTQTIFLSREWPFNFSLVALSWGRLSNFASLECSHPGAICGAQDGTRRNKTEHESCRAWHEKGLRQPTCCLVSYRSKECLFVIQVFFQFSLELERSSVLCFWTSLLHEASGGDRGGASAALLRGQMVFQWVRL